jgi:hypothetical protein
MCARRPCAHQRYNRGDATATLANQALSKARRTMPLRLPRQQKVPLSHAAADRFLRHSDHDTYRQPAPILGTPGPAQTESFNESVSTFRLGPHNLGPILPTCAAHKVVGYPRYCGRAGQTAAVVVFMRASNLQ